MSDNERDSKSDDFGETNRWRLAEFYLRRSEHSANFLRALLFALSAGAIAFIASKIDSINTWYHVASILSFLIAVIILAWSWEVQKIKSIKRFKTLRDKGYRAYRKKEKYYKKHYRNYIIDRFAFALIVIGFGIELVPVICASW